MKRILLHPFPLLLIAIMALVASCSVSQPGTTAPSEPVMVLKFVPYSKDNMVQAYFTLADVHTNQVASDGRLHVKLFTTTGLSIGEQGGGLKMQTILYDNTFAIASTNFHWETTGNMIQVSDLACRIVIPYDHIQKPFTKGTVATLQMDFLPEKGDRNLSSATRLSLY